jgi:hypothetical protein
MHASASPWIALLQREWLQHRFGWTLIAGIPLAIALLVVAFGRFESSEMPPDPDQIRLIAAFAAIAGTAVGLFAIACVTSIIFMAGLARRDHGDRSVEFWLSLPSGHAPSLAVPLATHLLLVPAAALVVGWLAGQLVCLVLLNRMGGLGEAVRLPWAELLGATLTLVLRFLAGLPLAVLWMLPLVLLLVLMNAWFKRWGWVVLAVAVLALGVLDAFSAGQRWLLDTAARLLQHAAVSLAGAGGTSLGMQAGDDPAAVLGALPALAWRDFLAALGDLASPLFVGALVASALGFWLLVRWRAGGAGLRD